MHPLAAIHPPTHPCTLYAIRTHVTPLLPRQMNLRSLCFARVARDRGEPWLWWEWVDKLGDECRMRDKLYTPECAQKVRSPCVGQGLRDCRGE